MRQDEDMQLQREWASHRAQMDEEDATARQDALISAARRAEELSRDEQTRRDEAQGVAAARAGAALLQQDIVREGALRARLAEFRGSDNASINERLRKEGFADALTENKLRERTLDQRVGNELGLKPAFGSGPEPSYSLGNPPGTPDDKQYLQMGESLYRSEVPETVRGSAGLPGTYENPRDKDRELGIRKGLGLGIDEDPSYGRVK